jgi:hypothetical protein
VNVKVIQVFTKDKYALRGGEPEMPDVRQGRMREHIVPTPLCPYKTWMMNQ